MQYNLYYNSFGRFVDLLWDTVAEFTYCRTLPSLPLPSPLIHFLSFLPSLPSPYVGSPLNQLEGLESAVSFPNGVRGGAPDKNEFGAL